MGSELKPFSNEGTVLSTALCPACDVLDHLDFKDGLIKLVELADRISDIVKSNSGVLLTTDGDSTLSYWSGEGHARRAFAAACSIAKCLKQPAMRDIPVQIALGTGELAGDFVGTKQQFQLVGKAMAILNRIQKVDARSGTCIRMSQFTLRMIPKPTPLEEESRIEREGLEELVVYAHCPAN